MLHFGLSLETDLWGKVNYLRNSSYVQGKSCMCTIYKVLLIKVVYVCIYWVDTMGLKSRIFGNCGSYVVPLIPN
jgi:hypothetical protein